MKKIVILFLLPALACLFPFTQTESSKTYLNKYGAKIEFKNDEFYYIESHSFSPVWYNDTLAVCTVKKLDGQFVELNSIPPDVIAQRGLSVIQGFDCMAEDSIKISFSIPYNNDNLNITVFSNTLKTFDLTYSKSDKELMLPNDFKTIAFTISPERSVVSHSIDGRFYGVLYYSSIEYTIEENTNHIEISIPAMDDSFFERYYVKGEYARVVNDSIFWRGDVFVKKSK
ncbi:hypothetical protein M2480_003239 [Parabacteroides sp. PFB2-12]|uniref:hypothetical protein n=1 Tax=unclassified Parabacteroides TaxID=2649774 RepID=UPI002473A552|nr:MULTISPECIES: hypothetical protein [unclassified Parabacteroides]MDH6344329.1 hypothetical protein [Parabacteroides sp. PM6-13]MDH6392226.1 hypothetical protein [Parabacteroides sp. PFB2-12]